MTSTLSVESTVEAEAASQAVIGGTAAVTWIDVLLQAVHYVTDEITLYDFRRTDGAVLPPAEPGAHIDIELPNGMVRQYSLINPDTHPRSYQIAVKRDPSGSGGSIALHDTVRCGARLRVGRPRNNFPLDTSGAPVALIAGGIGITPILSMARHLSAIDRSMQIHYACRSRSDAAFLDQLEALCDSLHLHCDDEHEGHVMDIPAIVAAAPANTNFYCCGPSPMLAGFEQATKALQSGRVHCEHFAAIAVPTESAGFIVELAQSARALPIAPGQSILDVLEAAGIPVSHSCRKGICGACETKVLSGIPDHRDTVLSPAERASNRTMMICCSGALGDRIVLDI